jgi:protein-S-isoprenylcysteine O-methyltransferase Ste14
MYLFSQLVILLWALFLCNIGWFRIDENQNSMQGNKLIINTVLVSLFVLQHMIMARRRFKKWLSKIIPPYLVRSTFVGTAAFTLLLIALFWQPMTDMIYQVQGPGRFVIWGLYLLGWALVVVSTRLIDEKALHGIRQSFSGRDDEDSQELLMPSLYRWVRHPMMLGFIIVLWANPAMTEGRLLLASFMTLYILIGIKFEERGLIRKFGKQYENYKKRVPALFPWPFRSAK